MKIKTTSVSVNCPFSLKNETAFVRYIEDGGKLLMVSALGCDKNYHACSECSKCLEESRSIFIASFNASS